MKRRVTSILLALIMLLSLLPASAFAANEGPVLKMHVRMEDNGNVFEEPVTEWTQSLGDYVRVKFVLHEADGSTSQVKANQVQLPDFLTFEGDVEDGWIHLTATDVGTGVISYQDYTVAITAVLPNLGLYSALPASADTWIENFTVEDNSTVFYIALNPGLTAEGVKMDTVSTEFEPGWNERNLLDVADIELSQDGSYATVTITDMTAKDHYHFEVNLIDRNGDPCGRWGMGIWINNNMPRLYYCSMWEENGQWIIEYEHLEDMMHCVPGDSRTVAFFFGKRSDVAAGRVDPIPVEDLTFPAYLRVEDLADRVPSNMEVPPHAVEVIVTRFEGENESTDIVYEHEGTAHAIAAETFLSDLGFYSSTEVGQEAFIHNNDPFVFTEEDRTVYLCVSDPESMKLTSEWKWDSEDAEDLFTVTPSEDENGEEDGKYLIVTLKENEIASNKEYHMELQIQRRNREDEPWFTERCHIALAAKNGQPALMYRYLDWDESKEMWYEDEERELNTNLHMPCGGNTIANFYYGTEESMLPVDISELTFPAGVAKGFIRDGVICVEAIGYEEVGYITYTKGDVTASMKVNSHRPEAGFYSSRTADKSTFLGREIPVDQSVDTFYVVSGSEEFTVQRFEEIRQNFDGSRDVSEFFDVTFGTNDDGLDYAKITLKKGDDGKYLAAGGEYVILLEQDWGIFYVEFKLIRNDLEQLATPSDLVWHKEYGWNWGENKLYEEERMGAMGFKTGDPSQNRYAIELYSDADGYTTPVISGGWQFGDMDHSEYFSVVDFIYADLPSGSYRFRVKAEGDGTKYRDSEWSALSDVFQYTQPDAQLTPVNEETFTWERWEGMYHSVWEKSREDAALYYEVRWSYLENGVRREHAGSFDMRDWEKDQEEGEWNPRMTAGIPDEFLSEIGNKDLYFRVRVIPADITQYRISPWSDYSEALVIQDITDFVNNKLDNLLNQQPSQPEEPQPELTVQQVQDALMGDTADLRTAMAADLELSGGPSSGTLALIEELEKAVTDNVEQKVEAAASAPAAIQDIADGITMVGATLNLAEKDNGNQSNPTITLKLDEPEEGIVIPEQQHNAVQFSMKLNGAVDKNDKEEAGQLLIVPVVIDMPVPAGINPDFLVVLHKLWDGSIEQMRPYIYWNEENDCYHARFVVDSFSDFALVEYFGFDVDVVNKQLGDASFAIVPAGGLEDSTVTYVSSDSDIAEVDFETGEVTIKAVGTVTITATVSASGIYSETSDSYTLIVTSKPSYDEPSDEPSDEPYDEPSVEPSVPVKPENPFGDVAEEAYYYDAVLWAMENGITNGTDETHFSPDFSCTRAQAVTFLWRAAGSPKPVSTEMPFTDIQEGSYYYDAVLWAIENGITNGTSATTFSPDAKCTRAQIVTFLMRELKSVADSADNPFSDVDSTAYYTDAVLWAVENGITNGTSATTFSPNADCTRAQIVTFLYRALKDK